MRKQTEKLFNSMVKRNEHFEKALKLMNENQVKYIHEIFETIQTLKDEKKSIKKFIDIAVKHDDYESETMYENRWGNIHSEIEYQIRILNEYINQVIAYES